MRLERWLRLAPVLALGIGLSACPEKKNPVEPDEDPLAITTAALEDGAVGESYAAGIDAEGGDGGYVWTIPSGSLPPGLSLEVDDLTDDDALITGVPTVEGNFDFVLRVTSEDGQARSRSFDIEVVGEPEPIGIVTIALPPGLLGSGYSTPLRAFGGDGENFTWTLSGGTLPAGLALVDENIQGTPSVADTVILTFRVTSGGFEAERAFPLQVVANQAGFNLTVAPVVPIPAAIQPAVDAAVARWQSVITGDVSQAAIPVGFFADGQCSGFGSVLNGTSADDIIVLINIVPIDGPAQVLGQGGPCVVRANDLPFAGALTLDSDDLLLMSPSEVTDLLVHEIGHVLGFGSLWDFANLIGGTSGDPRFTGPSAVNEWNSLGGVGQVPVENTGGSGTAGAHWRESVFDEELMTGFAENSGFQPLSRVSIASLGDLGYTVNLGAADVFNLTPPMGVAAAALDRATSRGYDIVLTENIRRIEADGSVTTLRRRTP